MPHSPSSFVAFVLALALVAVGCSKQRRFASNKPPPINAGGMASADAGVPAGGAGGAGGGSGGNGTVSSQQRACDPDVDQRCECDVDACLSTLGGTCSRQGDCSQGRCEATDEGHSVCCAEDCSDDEVCAADGTGCGAAAPCSEGDDRCDGADYQRCESGAWRTRTACGELGCTLARPGCKLSAGEVCTDTGQCGEGSCEQTLGTDRVCCTASCGPCRACRANGTSCQNREDDDACGVIVCPEDTTCRDYFGDVASARCVDGSCGSAVELCSFAARNVGLECGDDSLCDGDGDCAAPKLGQGQSCSDASQCNSGFCTEGVCCNEGCTGVCETCATTGQCRMPEQDVRCDEIRCSELDGACAQTTTDLSSNLCGSRGSCAALEACGLEPDGTPCPLNGTTDASCDGAGRCMAPAVSCDGGECIIAGTTTCCASQGSPGVLSCTADCPTPPNTPVQCDQNLDCPTGEVCCLLANPMQALVQCRPATECAVPNTSSVLHFALCDSPAMTPEERGCPAGTCTFTGFTTLAGWTFCEVLE